MHTGRFVFSQLTDFIPMHEFRACVARYRGNFRVRDFSCFDQFLSMAYAQLTGRESLRETETCLRAYGGKLYHAGFRGTIARSTLADANEHRDWHIYADFAHVLIAYARRLYAGEPLAVDLEATVYVLDSTTIDLCLSLFPWARYQRRKGAIKLHTLLDLRGSIPYHVHVSDGKMHDVRFLDYLIPEPGAFYIMDRGYVDFARLYRLCQCLAYFVVRSRGHLVHEVVNYRPVDRTTGLRSDHTIRLTGSHAAERYPAPLRRVAFYDAEHHHSFAFLTNHFDLPALTVTELYHDRWNVELFFKWIKQHLRLKTFFGMSENAVKTQIWIAISVYVLVAIVKKELNLPRSMNEILQILSVCLFEQVPVSQLLMANSPRSEKTDFQKSLPFKDL
jgi:hypothetical protein